MLFRSEDYEPDPVGDRIGFRGVPVIHVSLIKEPSSATSVAVLDGEGNNNGDVNVSDQESGSFPESGLDLTVNVKDQYGFPIGKGTLRLSMSDVEGGTNSTAFVLTPQEGVTQDENGLITWNGTSPIKVNFSFGEGKSAADVERGKVKIQATFHPENTEGTDLRSEERRVGKECS